MTTRVDRAGEHHRMILQLVNGGELAAVVVGPYCIPGQFYWCYYDPENRVLGYCTEPHVLVPLCPPHEAPQHPIWSLASNDDVLGALLAPLLYWDEEPGGEEILPN